MCLHQTKDSIRRSFFYLWPPGAVVSRWWCVVCVCTNVWWCVRERWKEPEVRENRRGWRPCYPARLYFLQFREWKELKETSRSVLAWRKWNRGWCPGNRNYTHRSFLPCPSSCREPLPWQPTQSAQSHVHVFTSRARPRSSAKWEGVGLPTCTVPLGMCTLFVRWGWPRATLAVCILSIKCTEVYLMICLDVWCHASV